MLYPNRLTELRYRARGYKIIAGVDEAGRGAWAGPIVAAAVVLDKGTRIAGIRDSKKLRSPERKVLYDAITNAAKAWAVGVIDAATIDDIGIQQANIDAMRQAVENLSVKPSIVLADGRCYEGGSVPCHNIIDGDHKVTIIAAASIVAKVTRDALMDELDEEYPVYGFKHHKGYGTMHHHDMLMRFGPCAYHRFSFEPMKYMHTQAGN